VGASKDPLEEHKGRKKLGVGKTLFWKPRGGGFRGRARGRKKQGCKFWGAMKGGGKIEGCRGGGGQMTKQGHPEWGGKKKSKNWKGKTRRQNGAWGGFLKEAF